MYTLFSEPKRHYGSLIKAANFDNVEARILEDVGRVVDYYRGGTFGVRNDHLLVRLIINMNVPLSYDLDHYYEVAVARSLFTANGLELTSSISAGKWFNGVFYNGCQELIIACNGDSSPSELMKDWRNLAPVKVLECPVSNMKYMLPDGSPHNIETGTAYLSIDIPMLMLQFRGFVLSEAARVRENPESARFGIRNFVAKYVIPNMLHTQTDNVIRNRMINLFLGAPMGDSRKRHPFHISDYTATLDKGLNELNTHLTRKKADYLTYLAQIPHVYNDLPHQMPDMAETRQVYWALFVTRFKLMDYLWEISGEEGRAFNKTYINQLKIDLKRFKSDNIFQGVLPIALLDDVNYFSRQVLNNGG